MASCRNVRPSDRGNERGVEILNLSAQIHCDIQRTPTCPAILLVRPAYWNITVEFEYFFYFCMKCKQITEIVNAMKVSE